MANPTYYYYSYVISCLFLLFAQFGAGDDPLPLLGGKKLIIGVPKKSGFTQFMDLQLNASDKTRLVQATGYSIDVFNATVAHLQSLGHNISFEFSPFVNESGNSAGTYDNLVEKIPAKKYDAVVGDVTIVANRSNYVEFTLPYAESGVKMLLKVRHDQHLNMWIFPRPFSWDLWLSIVIFCIFIGATIRFMERNVNRDGEFENSPRREQLTGVSILWLPLAQMVLPERESVAKNCSRFVLVMWLILAFVIMQSYTASLSSILTLDQLQPSYLSLNDLRRDPEINVGYQSDSFVRDLLVERLKFDESRLKHYSSSDDYCEALDKGSKKGGVAAIFDEVPYIKVFLKDYGSKSNDYAMVGPRYRTDGFGFAFPINSSLTSYFSRAILNVSQSEEMDKIEQKYFGSSDYEFQDQSNPSSDTPSPSLGTHSFAGLFLVIGCLTLSALLVSESRIWQRPVMLVKNYSQKYLLSPRFSKPNQSRDGSTTGGNVGSGDETNNHPKVPSRSLSSLDIETLPV